jgi:hypothetical protein
VVRGTVVLVEVERLPRETRKPKKLWLWWNGVAESDLDLLWRANCHRFDLEHTIRFLKQTLGWTTLRVRHPEQADRWTWLILAAYAQLRLAQVMVADKRLPWERRYPAERLTPLRTLRSFATLCRFWAHRRGARNLVAGLQGAPKASFPGNRRGKPRRAMVRYQGQLYLRSIHPLVVGEAPKPLRAVE